MEEFKGERVIARLRRAFGSPARPWPAERNDRYWKHVEKLIPEIVESQKHKLDSPPVGPVVLTKLNVQRVAGYNYHMTLSVKDKDGVTGLYKAKVWSKIRDLGIETLSFEKVSGSGDDAEDVIPE